MYLDLVGEWNLPPLVGISTAPLLAADGAIRAAIGYDPATELWCCQVPPLCLPERPQRGAAAVALSLLRAAFKTFPFADAIRKYDPVLGVDADATRKRWAEGGGPANSKRCGDAGASTVPAG